VREHWLRAVEGADRGLRRRPSTSPSTPAGSLAFGDGADPVDMPGLVAGKQALVEELRAEKYVDLAEDYGWLVLHGQAAFDGRRRFIRPRRRWPEPRRESRVLNLDAR
jgi:hypothetical protein